MKKHIWKSHVTSLGDVYVDAIDAMEACARVEAYLDREFNKSGDRSDYKIDSIGIAIEKQDRI